MSRIESITLYVDGGPLRIPGRPVSGHALEFPGVAVVYLDAGPSYDVKLVRLGDPVPDVPDLVVVPVEGTEGEISVVGAMS